MGSRRTLGAAVVCSALLVTGCGSDSKSEQLSAAAAAASTTTIPAEQATALAQQALLRIEDFPPGWTQVESDPDDILRFPGAECARFEEIFNGPGLANDSTVDFSHDELLGILHTVAVGDPGAIATAMGAMSDAQAPACFENAVRQGTTVDEGDTLEVHALPSALSSSKTSAAIVVSIGSTSVDGSSVSGRVRFQADATGRAISMLTVISFGDTTFDPSAIAAKALSRLQAIA